MSSDFTLNRDVRLPDLVARDLLTAALSRLALPDTTITVLGLEVTCTADGRALHIRDATGFLLERLSVPTFVRADTDAAIAIAPEAGLAPAAEPEVERKRG